jgi:hypothetical protein
MSHTQMKSRATKGKLLFAYLQKSSAFSGTSFAGNAITVTCNSNQYASISETILSIRLTSPTAVVLPQATISRVTSCHKYPTLVALPLMFHPTETSQARIYGLLHIILIRVRLSTASQKTCFHEYPSPHLPGRVNWP